MAESDSSGTAYIIHPETDPAAGPVEMQERAEEAAGLARAIALGIAGTSLVRIKKPSPGHLIGKGKRDEIAAEIAALTPDVVIVNHTLSPVQQRNLEKAWKAKILDRTGLILEIFGRRAQSREGRIQVELAALEYQKSRLVRSWTHLERQRGGAGFMGGPGETQIEMDRRIISDRISRLKKELEQVRRTRDLQRRSRERVPYPQIALVGYTNAGKSTLFNRLTGAGVFAEDLLFATLDPTTRRLELPDGQVAVISDTVGFISDLPTHLVAAFRATLEQLDHADIILHVRDISRPDTDAQKRDVEAIMRDLGIDCTRDPRLLEVWNKTDLLPEEEREEAARRARFSAIPAVPLSARKGGQGIADLLDRIAALLAKSRKTARFRISPADGGALAWLHRHANILEKEDGSDYIELTVEIDPADIGRFQAKFSCKPV